MKKMMAFMLCLLSCICPLCATVAAASESDASAEILPKEPSFEMLILGDSISTGYGLEGSLYKNTGYANLTAEALGLPAENFVNKAVNGDTSSDLLKLLPHISEKIENAELIVFSIGGNDVIHPMMNKLIDLIPFGDALSKENLGNMSLRTLMNILDSAQKLLDNELIASLLENESVLSYFDSLIEGYKTNLDLILSYIYGVNPETTVIVQTLYNPTDDVTAFAAVQGLMNYVISGINDATAAVTEKYGSKILDVYGAFAGKGSIYTRMLDADIHPNEEGHAKIAELLIPAAKEVKLAFEAKIEAEKAALEAEKAAEARKKVILYASIPTAAAALGIGITAAAVKSRRKKG